MLALPHAIANFGLIPGILMLVIGAVNMYISLYCFTILLDRYQSSIYSELAKKVMGSSWEKFVHFIFSFYLFGTLIGYLLVGKLFIFKLAQSQLINHFKMNLNEIDQKLSILILLVVATFTLPFNLLNSVNKLKSILIRLSKVWNVHSDIHSIRHCY